MKYIDDYDFQGKKALIRVDFNVPLDDRGQITNTNRIEKALPTIRKVLSAGGAAILLSHLGRPQKGNTNAYSLQQLVPYLQATLETTVSFSADCVGNEATLKAQELSAGQVLLLENVRFHPEEEQGDAAFAQALAKLCNVYVNDAFGTIHRQHASTYTITKYLADKVGGYLLGEEINNANKLLSNIDPPFTVIIGGTKIVDKLPVMENLLDKLDTLLIGGGIANTFHLALGGKVGNSVVESSQQEAARNIFYKAIDLKKKLVLPPDVIIANQFNNQAHTAIVPSNAVPAGWMAIDIGPTTQGLFQGVIEQSKTILWTGPIGAFEIPPFSHGTQVMLEAVSKATQHGAFSFIGGGDSATAVTKFGYADKVSYISTGGGALLAYLANPHLPVIEALNK